MLGAIDWANLANITFVATPIGAIAAALIRKVWKHSLNQIMHEFQPNSGSSLRDAVDRIERQQETQHHEQMLLIQEIKSDLKAHEAYHAGQDSAK